MAILFITSGTIGDSDARAVALLQSEGGYTVTTKDDSTITSADIDASDGVVVGRGSSSTNVRGISRLTQAGGPGKPMLVLNRAVAKDFALTDDEFGSGSTITQIYLRSEGVVPLDGGSSGTKTVLTSSATLQFIQGTVAPGAILYTNQSQALGTKFGHLLVPAGGSLLSGTAAVAIGYATWPASADIPKMNSTFEKYFWKTAINTLGPPVSGGGGGTDTLAPSVPGNLNAVTTGATTVALTWNASTDATGVSSYRVNRRVPGGSWTPVAASTSETTFNDSGLQPVTTYEYTVSAVDAAGNRSAESNLVAATTTAASLETTSSVFIKTITGSRSVTLRYKTPSGRIIPPLSSSNTDALTVPVNVTRSVSGTQATMSWEPPSSGTADAYFIARDGSDSNGYGAYSTDLAGTARTVTFYNLIPGNAYTLRVAARASNGTLGPASVGTVTIPVDGGPNEPTPITDFASHNDFTYSSGWTAIAAEHYTSTDNATVTIYFNTTQPDGQITVRAHAPGNNRGVVGFRIDGGTETTLDLYSTTPYGDAPIADVWTSPALPIGQHTLVMRATGQKNAAITGNEFYTIAGAALTGGTFGTEVVVDPEEPVDPGVSGTEFNGVSHTNHNQNLVTRQYLAARTGHDVITTGNISALTFGNVYGTDPTPPNSLTIRASVEVNGVRHRLVGPNNETDIVIGPKTYVRTFVQNNEQVSVTQGQRIYVHVKLDTGTTAGQYPVSNFVSSTFDERMQATSSDLTMTGTPDGSLSGQIYGPTMIGVTPSSIPAHYFAVWGDSIAYGSNRSDGRSYLDMPLTTAGIPHMKFALIGEQGNGILGSTARKSLFGVDKFTHVVWNYGINDFNSNANLATVQGRAISGASQAAGIGSEFIVMTLTPKATGDVTDPNAMTPNLPTGQEALRLAYNEWLRDGAPLSSSNSVVATGTTAVGTKRAEVWNSSGKTVTGTGDHPFHAIVDAAAEVTVTNTNGDQVWKANIATTGDSFHPNGTGHSLMAAVWTKYITEGLVTAPTEPEPTGSGGTDYSNSTLLSIFDTTSKLTYEFGSGSATMNGNMVRLTPQSVNEAAWGMNITPRSMTDGFLRIRAGVSNRSNLRWWRVYIAESKSALQAGNFKYATIANYNTTQSIGYPIGYSMHPNNVASSGSVNLANIGYVEFRVAVTSSSNTLSTVDLLDMYYQPNASTKGKVVIWHDDGGASANTLQGMLDNYGWKVTLAASIGRVGTGSSYMSVSEIQAMNAAGVQVGTHDYDGHADLSGQGLVDNFNASRARQDSLGLTGGQDFAWWGGMSAGSSNYNIVKDTFRSARYNASSISYPDTLPVADPWMTMADLVGSTDTATDWIAMAEKAADIKGVFQLVFHNDLRTSELNAFLAWCDANRDKVEVVTIEEALGS